MSVHACVCVRLVNAGCSLLIVEPGGCGVVGGLCPPSQLGWVWDSEGRYVSKLAVETNSAAPALAAA